MRSLVRLREPYAPLIRVGQDLMVSRDFLPPVPEAERFRGIIRSAADYYAASPAKDDPSKLSTLSAEWPERRAAAEHDADVKFREYWAGAKDTSQRLAIEIAGAGAALVIAFPLVVMGAAIWASWEAAKKFWSWAFGVGKGYSQEWVDAAKANVTEMLSYGIVPPAFDEAFHVSPMGYAKSLAKDLNVVRHFDEYAGPGMKEHFLNTTASIWRAASVNPIVREDVGKITVDPNGWPLAYATRLDAPSGAGGLAGSRAMVEMIGIAALIDEGASIYVWDRAMQAAMRGWNEGIALSDRERLPRSLAYDGADYEDGDVLVSPGGGAIAATMAYAAAREEAKRAMGRWWESPSPVPAPLPGSGIMHPDTSPPDRNGMPQPTLDDPVPAGPVMLAVYATESPGGTPARGSTSSWPILGFGAVASTALYIAKQSIGIAAAPFAAALAYVLWRKS